MSSKRAHVGEIHVGSPDAQVAHQLFEHLDEWLTRENWSHAVSVQIATGPLAPTQNRIEIVLEPGEYQSNRRKKLIYANMPALENLDQTVKNWLCEVEE